MDQAFAAVWHMLRAADRVCFAEQAYLCAINEVYECVALTGCSRISLEDANLAGVLLIDVEKKQLSSAPLGEDPTTDAIDSVTVADDAVPPPWLRQERHRQDLERCHVSENWKSIGWCIYPSFVACALG
jgi:hypothetical protein